jgi:hypothetical protein
VATLTATQLAKIRLQTGAADATVWTADIIQAEYDLALVDAPESADIFPYTYVYVLRLLWGETRPNQDYNTTHGDRQPRQQISTITKELLDYWEGKTGLSGGILTSGSISLGIDQDEEETA